MQISEQQKLYLKVFGVFFFIVYLFYTIPNGQFTCEKWANNFKNNEEFHLVLTGKKMGTGSDAYLDGIDINNKNQTEYKDGSGWIEDNLDTFKIGDTLTKDIGKYTIIIKRGDKTILIPFKCEDKVYK